MTEETYIQMVIREFGRLKVLAERAIAQVGDDEFFAELDPESNSIAIIVKHVAGNMSSRWRDFLTSDGEKLDRNRDSEFTLEPGDTRENLTGRWETGWKLLFGAIEPLGEADMQSQVTIRGEPLTVLQAINRQLSHYAYHVGQIVLIAKHLRGASWTSLSVAKGQSAAFNAKPERYLDDERP